MKPSVLLSRLAVVSFFVSATVSSQQLELEKVERLPTPVMDPASDDAQLAIKRFSLPKGLQAKLWAAEPMLANPVAIDFDENIGTPFAFGDGVGEVRREAKSDAPDV